MKLEENLFWKLGIGLEADEQAVEEQVEEKEEEEEGTDWEEMAKTLGKPRERLEMEIAWTPGVDPDEAAELVRQATEGVLARPSRAAPLAEVNLRVAALVATRRGRNDTVEQLLTIARCLDMVDPAAATQQVNRHRAQAGIKAKATEERVGEALDRHRRWIGSVVKDEFDAMATLRMVDTVRELAEVSTQGGTRRAPQAIRDWIHEYEKGCRKFFNGQKKAVEVISKQARRAVSRDSDEKANELVNRFCEAVRGWDRVAQPIQLVHQGEGSVDGETKEMFNLTRDFAIALHNEHSMTDLSLRIVSMQKEVFAEAEKLEERVAEDKSTLEEILSQQEKEKAESQAEASYEAVVGKLKKTKVSVDPKWIRLGDGSMETAAVTTLRWGGIQQSINGIPTGTRYDVWIGDGYREIHWQTSKMDVFTGVTRSLMLVAGWGILNRTLERLAKGERVTLGEMTIMDGGVLLRRRRWLGADDLEWITWRSTMCTEIPGGLEIQERENSERKATVWWRDTPNAIVMRMVIDRCIKGGKAKLSEAIR